MKRKTFYIDDFENSQSFVVMRRTEQGDQLAASFHYGFPSSKRVIRRAAGLFVWTMNLLNNRNNENHGKKTNPPYSRY